MLVTQSCHTLWDPMDCSPPGSSVHEIFQARILEWVAISFSRGSSQPRDRTRVSRIVGRCFSVWATTEAPICMRFSENINLLFTAYVTIFYTTCTFCQWKLHHYFIDLTGKPSDSKLIHTHNISARSINCFAKSLRRWWKKSTILFTVTKVRLSTRKHSSPHPLSHKHIQ